MRPLLRVLGMQCALSGCLLASTSASATDESLSFRRTASGSIEAVVSGLTNLCAPVFLSPGDVTVEGTTVTITSPKYDGLCPLPSSPFSYAVTADLGMLTGQSYQVVWNQPVAGNDAMQLSAVLVPAATVGAAISAPTLAWPALAVLTLVLGVFAWRHGKSTRSTT